MPSYAKSKKNRRFTKEEFQALIDKSVPFKVGKIYYTIGGKKIKIIKISNEGTPYECIQGNDGASNGLGWRYNRASDRGRCTASEFDYSNINNLIPVSA
jgi:hypothetical protein